MNIFRKILNRHRERQKQQALGTALFNLERAWIYLWKQYWSEMSTQERDFLTVPQKQALAEIDTASRFVKFELTGAL